MIEHKQTVGHYDALLGKTSQQAKDSLMDDSALESSKKRRAITRGGGAKRVRLLNPLLAIDDKASDLEVEPEDAEEKKDKETHVVGKIVCPPGIVGTKVDAALSRNWGPFHFRWVWRVKASGKDAGSYSTQWECVCNRHSDGPDDDTQCRKTRNFDGEEDCEVQCLWLQRWLLAGRHCRLRSDKKEGHLYYKKSHYALVPVERLDGELQEGLDAESWIIKEDADDAVAPSDDGKDDESGHVSGSHSGSSSSSSSTDSSSDSD